MKTLKCAVVLASVVCMSSVYAQATKKVDDKKDIVKATKTIAAKLMSFEVGDYVHAILKDAKGKEHSMWIDGEGVDYFLAIHAKKMLTIKYQTVSTYIPEAGGRETIDRIISAKFGKLDSATWWKAERKKSSVEALTKKYDPLMQKLSANGG